ncbi:MAG: hypothetical protein VKL42_16970 [Snowella sp.]|nr:hypothetical protein [Snowella sp.]
MINSTSLLSQNIYYIIGSKGSDRPRIEQLINKDLNLENYVTLAGFAPDEQLAESKSAFIDSITVKP